MPNEKTRVFGVILFVLVGVSALILGIIQAKQRIAKPFVISPEDVLRARALLEGPPVDKTKDTDGDGIPDYDEQNVYRTSAYIKDSDSDGTDDKTEIERGSNPNCPEGKDCGTVPPPPAPSDGTGLLGEAAGPSPDTGALDADTAAALAPPTAERIRQMLREAGVPDETLKTVSDEELLQLYAESAAESAPPTNTPVPPSAGPTP